MCDDETELPIPVATVAQPATQGPSTDVGNDEQRREAGQKRAEQRELIRRAARRAVIFGLQADDDQKADGRRCEAVQNGRVVEPSFAKGDFAIRWRS